MNNLNQAISIAAIAHINQVDKAGEPYIFHPLKVMFQMESEEEQIVAVLHDVVEDTDVTSENLDLLFTSDVFEALDAITKRKDEVYQDYIERVAKNEIATAVKIADLLHNLDRNRIPYPEAVDNRRYGKYETALTFLVTGEWEV